MQDKQQETINAEEFIEKHPIVGVMAKIGAVAVVIALIALVNGIVVAFELFTITADVRGQVSEIWGADCKI